MTVEPNQPVLLDVAPAGYASIVAFAVAAANGNETGGVLLGHDCGGPVVEVRRAGDAGPAAVRRTDRFVRDPAHAQRLADAAFAADGSLWLGEWHTHPGGEMRPSPVDLAAYAALLEDPSLRLRRFVTVIVTASPEHGWARPVLAPWLIDHAAVREMTLSVVTAMALRTADF